MLIPMMAVVFAAFLGLALMAMYAPTFASNRAARAARLDEVLRYRRPTDQTDVKAAHVRTSATPNALSQHALHAVDRALRARGRRGDVAGELERAGMRIRPEEWTTIQLSLCVVAAAALYVLSGSIWVLPLGAVAGWFGCRTYLKVLCSRREAAFLAQIPETLQLVAGSLKAGFSLAQALNTVVREGSEPTAGEFNRALTEVRLGANLEDALDGVAERMNCDDLAWVIIAIRISREVGGNLAEVMETTVATMRSRAELRGLVRSLSAEGRTSAKVLAGLPFFVAAFIALTNPSYLGPLFHSGTGILLLGVGGVLLGLGILWLRRLVDVKL